MLGAIVSFRGGRVPGFAAEKRAEGGEAGTDDGETHFDGRPGCSVSIGICRGIVSLGLFDEEGEMFTACVCLLELEFGTSVD